MIDHVPQHHDPGSRRPLYRMIAGLAALLLAGVIVIALLAIAIVNSLGGSGADGPAVPDRSLPAYWLVRHGQTYSTIAAKTGLTVDQLETFNPRQDPTALVPGQHIKLRLHPPPLHPKRLGPRVWIVRRGQSFSSIAAKTGHSISALQRLNPHLKATALQPGQRMKLRR
ncbi:MAG TPA: LysM peptidoglycan-binding domain-containing protein [Solirubrobacteraceae bacterium]|jgi:LysM repeat protein